MAITLGKRKRHYPQLTEAIEKKTSSSPERNEDLEAFRQHFEAQFQPLQEHCIKAKAIQAATRRRQASSDEDDDSEWDGLSNSEDQPNVEIIEHASPTKRAKDELPKEEFKAFMTPKPPATTPPTTTTSTPARKQAQIDHHDDSSTDATNLRNDLALQRLLSESHLLDPTASQTLNPSGINRHKALDMRLQSLGSRKSILTQTKMPLAHRKGITAKKKSREEERRREARENGIILEKERRSGLSKGKIRQRGVDAPSVGKFKGGTLRLSRRDVASIEGPKRRAVKGKGKRRL